MADEIEQADAVALVLAHLHGDEQAIEDLLAMHGARPLFAATVGLLVDRLLADSYPGGVAGLEATLLDWARRRE